MSPGDGGSPHSSVGDPIMRLHEASLIFINDFLVSSTRGLVGIFSLFHIPECLCIIFEIGLSRESTVTRILSFLYTSIVSNVIQISPGSLILLFYVAFVVPSFTAFHKHELVADPVGLRISIRVISRLIV